MTQEEKELLLKDICARLLYGVKVSTNRGPELVEGLWPFNFYNIKIGGNDGWWFLDFKPYLRPISSMTKEERYEIQGILGKDIEIIDDFINIIDSSRKRFSFLELQAVFDWLNAHHFDYRGLIERGLALEAKEGMYEINEK